MRPSAVGATVPCFFVITAILCAVPAFAAPRMDERAAQSVAHYIMGVNHDFNGAPVEAVREYEKAVYYDSNAFLPHLRLGADLLLLGNHPEAVKILERAVALSPRDMHAHYSLALAYSSVQNMEKAAKEYEIILKDLSSTEPANPEFYIYLGQLYYSMGKDNEAALQLEKALELSPRHTEVMYTLAMHYTDAGNNSRAVELLKRCEQADPVHGGCLNSLGYIYAENGENLDEAQALIARALAADPENAAYLDSLGWVYYKKGKYIEALKELTKAAEKEKDPTIDDHLGEVYLKLGRQDMARKSWQDSLDKDPDQPALRAKLNDLDRSQVKTSAEKSRP